MPLYAISTRAPLPMEKRTAIAHRITDVHCAHTGAPRAFVTVMFWTRVPLPADQTVNLFGSVRAGRSDATNTGLKHALIEQLASVCAVDPSQIGFGLFEIPAHQIMEGGAVLPDPGNEAEWLAQHRVAPA